MHLFLSTVSRQLMTFATFSFVLQMVTHSLRAMSENLTVLKVFLAEHCGFSRPTTAASKSLRICTTHEFTFRKVGGGGRMREFNTKRNVTARLTNFLRQFSRVSVNNLRESPKMALLDANS